MPGEVPTGWAGTTLGALFSWSSGRKPPFAIAADGPIPVYGSNGILGFGPEANVARAYLIGRVGASGSLHTVQATAWANDNTLVAEPSDGKADFGFLGFVLGAANLPSLATKTAQPLLTQSNLRPVPVLVPPLPEQKKIASILSSVDEAIQATQLVVDQTRRVKEGLLQDLLTRGLPGHTRFKATEIGEIPESWEVRTLESAVQKDRPITYGIVQTGPHVADGIPCVRVVDMVKDDIVIESMIRTTPEISRSYRRTVLHEGDIMLALRGEIGHVRMVDAALTGANLTRGVALVSPGNAFSPAFLLWALRSPATRDALMRRVNGSALKEIPLGELRQVPVPCPPVGEQAAMASILDETAAAERRGVAALATLRDLKTGLLEDLLTGKVRVSP